MRIKLSVCLLYNELFMIICNSRYVPLSYVLLLLLLLLLLKIIILFNFKKYVHNLQKFEGLSSIQH